LDTAQVRRSPFDRRPSGGHDLHIGHSNRSAATFYGHAIALRELDTHKVLRAFRYRVEHERVPSDTTWTNGEQLKCPAMAARRASFFARASPPYRHSVTNSDRGRQCFYGRTLLGKARISACAGGRVVPLSARWCRCGESSSAVVASHIIELRHLADIQAHRYRPAQSDRSRARPNTNSGNIPLHWRMSPSR
jgi:hypothetical protein